MYRPDRTDWKIIALLNEDGRMSSAEIARQLGDVSARSVSNRINALTEQGVINIRSIVNPEAVGYGVLADVLPFLFSNLMMWGHESTRLVELTSPQLAPL